ncbi:hypothetical protein AMAG_10087 [Allomyces macrogynus ATCC 38327]|uniref:Uncharacterized protein n=1 Tax=Allomyces macrogynus (strain ATCC 38327) TaxID=578462 RepID=A0A0L0SQB2_ALLM3|nr:hypothetical protein AMAG_10087 [Allomyces macrogynus ATCC 38327]|eukprot:KNE64738.1 hypothetical protein AMAG_10087 [Allomyces macrogynus ATCC 38327]
MRVPKQLALLVAALFIALLSPAAADAQPTVAVTAAAAPSAPAAASPTEESQFEIESMQRRRRNGGGQQNGGQKNGGGGQQNGGQKNGGTQPKPTATRKQQQPQRTGTTGGKKKAVGSPAPVAGTTKKAGGTTTKAGGKAPAPTAGAGNKTGGTTGGKNGNTGGKTGNTGGKTGKTGGKTGNAGKKAGDAANANGKLNNGAAFCKSAGFGNAIADGTQKRTVTCSQTVQGVIPAFDKMVSTIILTPASGTRVKRGQDIAVSVRTQNMQLGFFEDPASRYYLSPQTLNGQGVIEGHQHVALQRLGNGQAPPDPRSEQLSFFKGLDQKSNNNVLTVTIPGANLTQAGTYRLCTITGTRSHQPVIMPVARRGVARTIAFGSTSSKPCIARVIFLWSLLRKWVIRGMVA